MGNAILADVNRIFLDGAMPAPENFHCKV